MTYPPNTESTVIKPGFRAFTLVELLVVIGIIGVLISILLPTLNRVRRQANDVVCQSNLRQIGLACQNYGVDNRDFWPSSKYTVDFGSGAYRVGYGVADKSDPTKVETTYGFPATMHRLGYLKSAGSATGNSVWICPAALDSIKENRNTYAWLTSGVAESPWGTTYRKGGTVLNMPNMNSKERQKFGAIMFYVYDSYDNAPSAIGDPTSNSPSLPGTFGKQYYAHYSRSSISPVPFDASGKPIVAWKDPMKGIPIAYTLFLDGHVGRRVSYALAATPTTFVSYRAELP